MSTARSRAAGDTHPGLQRDNNEDRFFFDEAKGVYCVIDGVGGHNAGERAAAIAAEVLRAGIGRASEADLRAAFARASDAIYLAATQDPTLAGMACVASLAAVSNGHVRFAHVGDTRLYKLQAGKITKLTRDQSPVGELEDGGALTETEAMRHPRRNEIYKDLGSRSPGPDVAGSVLTGETTFEPDAALLLCSDGLSDQVSSGSIRRIVEAFAGSPALAVQELLTAANDAGGKDNVTVVIVEGERFASAVTARGPRRGSGASAPSGPAAVIQHVTEPITGASRRPAPVPPSPTRPGGPSKSNPNRWSYAAMGLVAGLILGAGGVLASRALGYDPQRLWAGATSTGPRTWVVGLEPSADFSSIGEALGKAAAGDTVTVGPGEYREAVTLKSGVRLVGSTDSLLKPPVGAGGAWTALTARGVTDAHVSGFVVGAGPGQPLAVGLLAEAATVAVDGLEISGAREAAVDLRAGARVTLSNSLIRDNEGAGVLVRAGAEPRLERNVIIHNGYGSPRRAGVVVEPGASPVLEGNGIGGNGGEAVQGWPAAALSTLAQRNVLSPAPGSAAVPAAAPARPAATRPPPAARPRARPAAGAGRE
jgi:serine/threonine protein phosphatase PrpC